MVRHDLSQFSRLGVMHWSVCCILVRYDDVIILAHLGDVMGAKVVDQSVELLLGCRAVDFGELLQ